jgi:hypothetical protein
MPGNKRAIKALSDEETATLRRVEGMGIGQLMQINPPSW